MVVVESNANGTAVANSEQQSLSSNCHETKPSRSMFDAEVNLVQSGDQTKRPQINNGENAADAQLNTTPSGLPKSPKKSARLDWHMEMLCGLLLQSDEQELERLERKVNLRTAAQHDASSQSSPQEGGHVLNGDVPKRNGRHAKKNNLRGKVNASEEKTHRRTNNIMKGVQTTETDNFLTKLLHLGRNMDLTVLSLVPEALRGVSSSYPELQKNLTFKDNYCANQSEKSTLKTRSDIRKASIGSRDATAGATVKKTDVCEISDGRNEKWTKLIQSKTSDALNEENSAIGSVGNSMLRAAHTSDAHVGQSGTLHAGLESRNATTSTTTETSVKFGSATVAHLSNSRKWVSRVDASTNNNELGGNKQKEHCNANDEEMSEHKNLEEAKIEQLGGSDDIDFDNPLLIPPSWRRSDYARRSLPQLEQHVVDSGIGRGGETITRDGNRNGKKNGKNGSHSRLDKAPKNYDVCTLLYNECSVSAMANWAMLDCPINISNSEEDKERWDVCKKAHQQRPIAEIGRHAVIIPTPAFHLCSVCGGFGHYEVECDFLFEGNADNKLDRDNNARADEGGMPEPKKKRVRGGNPKAVVIDKEFRDATISSLSKEIHVQRRQQKLFDDYCIHMKKEEIAKKKDDEDKNREENAPIASSTDPAQKIIKQDNAGEGNSHVAASAVAMKKLEKKDGASEGNIRAATPIVLAPETPDRRQNQKKEEGIDENQYTGKSSCCKICNTGIETAENVMLLCDGCDELFHCKCLDPPLEGIPEGDWFCSSCISHDSDASSVVEIEGCGDFVIEQRKRSVAEESRLFEGVSVGQSRSMWTTALSLLPEQDPTLKDDSYLRKHLGATKDFFDSELCWARRFDDQLGRLEWWPGMVTDSETRSLKSKKKTTYSVRFFVLDNKVEVHETEILPFMPYYEDIGHKRLVRCDNSSHGTFRRALILCVSTLGLKSLGQALKIARNGIQSAAVMGSDNRRLLPPGWKVPIGWRSADIDKVDGVVILAKEGGSEYTRTPANISHESIEIFHDRAEAGGMISNRDNNKSIQDSFADHKMVSEFFVDEIIGGVVSWQSGFSSSLSTDDSCTQYGVVISIDTATEMALVRAISVLSEASSGKLDDFFHNGSNEQFIHACNIGSTIWMPLEHVRFVSGKPSSPNLAKFRKKLKSNMGYEIDLYSAQCKREAKYREEYTIELQDPPGEDSMPQNNG